MTVTTLRTALAAVLAAGLLAALIPASSDAIVPPRNCGTMEVKGKRWQVKADALRCRKARRFAKRYIRTRDAPRYYKCRRGPRGSSLFAQCSASRYNPDRVFHIIRRRG